MIFQSECLFNTLSFIDKILILDETKRAKFYDVFIILIQSQESEITLRVMKFFRMFRGQLAKEFLNEPIE